MLRETGTTRLNVVRSPSSGPQVDPFMQAVREAAAGDFDVLGEIGRGNDGTIVYLARDMQSKRLVALKLQRDASLADEFSLEMIKHLEGTMPGLESRCSSCGKSLTGWARFCTFCGADLSGAPAAQDAAERQSLLSAVKEAVAGEYEVLGEMERREGGGAVYFARDLKLGKIVALRLTRENVGGQDSYSLGLTMAMKPLAASLGVKPMATQVLQKQSAPPPKAAPPPAPPRAAAPPPPPPLPHAAGGPPPLAAAAGKPNLKLIAGIVGALLVILMIVLLTLPSDSGEAAAPTATVPPAAQPTAPPLAAADPAPTTPTPTPTPGPDATIPPPTSGRLRIGTLPSGATLSIDGRPRTGRTFTLSAGNHTLAVRAPGYEPYTEVLEIQAAGIATWNPTLTRSTVAGPQPQAPRPPPAKTPTKRDSAVATVPSGPTCQTSVAAAQWNTAFPLCQQEANGGSAVAQYETGRMYEAGRGVKKSMSQAKSWYAKAAAQGHADAKRRLDAIELEEARQRRPF